MFGLRHNLSIEIPVTTTAAASALWNRKRLELPVPAPGAVAAADFNRRSMSGSLPSSPATPKLLQLPIAMASAASGSGSARSVDSNRSARYDPFTADQTDSDCDQSSSGSVSGSAAPLSRGSSVASSPDSTPRKSGGAGRHTTPSPPHSAAAAASVNPVKPAIDSSSLMAGGHNSFLSTILAMNRPNLSAGSSVAPTSDTGAHADAHARPSGGKGQRAVIEYRQATAQCVKASATGAVRRIQRIRPTRIGVERSLASFKFTIRRSEGSGSVEPELESQLALAAATAPASSQQSRSWSCATTSAVPVSSSRTVFGLMQQQRLSLPPPVMPMVFAPRSATATAADPSATEQHPTPTPLLWA